jgi:hypothetical protein
MPQSSTRTFVLKGGEMKITTMFALAAVVVAAMATGGVAQAQTQAQCVARCKAACAKNYPGYATCPTRCITRQCNK